jgi:6-phosphogluconolactonase
MKTMHTTRRQFLAASAALPFALRSFAETTAPRWVFLGTDKGAGIYRARWDAATGEIGKVELAIAAARPNYLAMHPKLPVLYTTNETAGPSASISCYHVDAADATLSPLNKIWSQADGPCYVSVDRTGRMAFAADYGGGGFAAYKLGPKGELASVAGTLQCVGNPVCGTVGPVKDRQEKAHLHCATVSPHNNFVLVCNLGEDAIEVFPIAPAEQTMGTPIRVPARAGSGPRHVAFHPNGKWVYVIHELDATIDIYDWRVRGGKAEMTLRAGSTISTLAAGASLAGNTGCEIVMGDGGRFVYACSRGVNEITVYRVGPAGLLTEQQRLSCGGLIPRYIALDPSRRWLVCCNQGGAGNVTVFAHDAATGRLSETPKVFAADTAMFVAWV